MRKTYVGHSVFGGRVVFTLEPWEQGDLVSAAAMRLHCFWADVLGVHEMSDTDATVPEIVNKIRELAKTGRLVTAETPREFAVGVAGQYLYDIDRLAEMVEVAAGWRRAGIVGRWIDDADVESNARAAASELAKKAQENAMPAFDELNDDLIDKACAAAGLYRVDLMRAYDVLKAGV